MHTGKPFRALGRLLLGLALCQPAIGGELPASLPTGTANLGPYNDRFLEGGIGESRPLPADLTLLAGAAAWSLGGWVWLDHRQRGAVPLASVGDPAGSAVRTLQLVDGRAQLRVATGAGPDVIVSASTDSPTVGPGAWHALLATYDGRVARLYLDGLAVASAAAATAPVAARLELAPQPQALAGSQGGQHFGGSLALFALQPAALEPAAVRALAASPPDFNTITFTAVGSGWPWQEHAWRGLQVPQDPWTLPHGLASATVGHATPHTAEPGLRATGPDRWTLGDWHLQAAPRIAADGARLSSPGYADGDWYAAVVPGTVLTTLIERGVYPDPDHGLDNLVIPDSLSRQDYWYRTEFDAPADLAGRQLTLTFRGINYAAEVWLNGARVGAIRGAFTRGIFDVTGLVRPGGRNALAVRVSPPPHPGIPHEQSVAAGPGENGGNLAIDGPTFIATEGWDWIPGIRDRNTGIWQDVTLAATGALRLLDPQVVTHLPLPRIDSADVALDVAVENRTAAPVAAQVVAAFGDVRVDKAVMLAPGVSHVALTAQEFPQLHLDRPRLWWPNGYGRPDLYELQLEVSAGGQVSDHTSLRFGVRELSYELSLFDSAGRLRRVDVDPTAGSFLGERLVDGRHEAIKRTPNGWAQSLTAAGERSAAVRDIPTESLAPYLAIRVNGVPIAVRGGSWGMDDSRKRVARARLEPYFRLEQAAHLNIVRNWLGQDTEEVFYELADEYGFLVLNDFWVSTQDFQVEPDDATLFLANARDVISRYRNHPSIAVWFGRNEGVPPPAINEGLADLVASLDGTRLYTGSSNVVNLQGSGPYNYRPPEGYFTTLAQGFSVEVGTPSVSTLESLEASIPPEDRWPLGDTYAYHDWHFGGNGDVATYMAAMADQHGAPTSLEDFERKAQLLDYDSYRAVFEGFQAHLWTRNSGRLLWMTHPSWPSNTWQVYSSDYDTAAPYYAVRKACEPLHAQLNLPDYSLAVVNISQRPAAGLRLQARLFTADGRLLATRTQIVDVAANTVTTLAPLPVSELQATHGLVLVRLDLADAGGHHLSDNLYWQGRVPADYRQLDALPAQPVAVTARTWHTPEGQQVEVTLRNAGHAPALEAKLTVLDAAGERVLPAYYDDNYIGLLPGEARTVRVLCPAGGRTCTRVGLRGWNVAAAEVPVTP
jgi:beta-galactosidase/beta-glucuronidase